MAAVHRVVRVSVVQVVVDQKIVIIHVFVITIHLERVREFSVSVVYVVEESPKVNNNIL